MPFKYSTAQAAKYIFSTPFRRYPILSLLLLVSFRCEFLCAKYNSFRRKNQFNIRVKTISVEVIVIPLALKYIQFHGPYSFLLHPRNSRSSANDAFPFPFPFPLSPTMFAIFKAPPFDWHLPKTNPVPIELRDESVVGGTNERSGKAVPKWKTKMPLSKTTDTTTSVSITKMTSRNHKHRFYYSYFGIIIHPTATTRITLSSLPIQFPLRKWGFPKSRIKSPPHLLHDI